MRGGVQPPRRFQPFRGVTALPSLPGWDRLGLIRPLDQVRADGLRILRGDQALERGHTGLLERSVEYDPIEGLLRIQHRGVAQVRKDQPVGCRRLMAGGAMTGELLAPGLDRFL